MAKNNNNKKKEEEEGFWKKAGQFFKNSYIKTRYKVTWPTKQELRQLTNVVIFVIVLSGLYFGVLDFIFGKIINKIATL